jgi:hypothetical protein
LISSSARPRSEMVCNSSPKNEVSLPARRSHTHQIVRKPCGYPGKIDKITIANIMQIT